MSEVQPDNLQLTVSSMLVSARQRAGLSVADMAAKLKLGMRQVEALEAGRYHELPGELFVRGFVRNYARLVGADEQMLQQTLNFELKPAAAPAIVAEGENIALRSKHLPRWLIVLGVLGLLALIVPAVVYYGLNRDLTLPLGEVTGYSANGPAVASVRKEQLYPVVAASAAGLGQQASELAVAAASAMHVASAVVSTSAGLIRLSFSGDSWVEIHDGAGSRVFYQVGHASQVANVSGAPPFDVVVGNASAVQVAYRGKPIDLAPFTKVSVARLKLQ